MKISIFGLGYVGTVSAACLSQHHEQIVGVDSNELKVSAIESGESPVVEPGVSQLLKEALLKHRLMATIDPETAIKATDISLICVGTPSRANGSLNLEYVFTVARQIGEALRGKKEYHGIAIRSTVLPGTVERVASIISESSGKAVGDSFGVASNPEFLREGTAVYDFENPPYTIVGASDMHMEAELRRLYGHINAPFFAMEIKAAELLKYACNSFHAVKVTFGNEIGAISKKLGIDSHLVMDVFTKDTKLNISPYYLKPGFAFGGSCLPKDVRALAYASRSLDISTPLLDSLMVSNEVQVQRTIQWVLDRKKKQIGVLGLSFKNDTDDLRESPMVKVVEALIGKGYAVSIFDSNVNISRLIGANKRYIEQEIPHISSLMKETIAEVLEHAEVVIIGNKSREFANVLSQVRPGQLVYDLARAVDGGKSIQGEYEGIYW